ncbi:MAG: hypothetical protein LBU89_01565 [Fibromonadaceae bacterium]|jgi:hypothetical protein|nr:hypothetical protein [Fibromonadaceae bacterium]
MEKRNFLAVGILTFVLVALLSCSNGGDDPSSIGNATGFQIYLENGSKYNESGVIRVEVYGPRKYEYIDIGTVKNGIGTLDFSKTIPSEYHQSPYSGHSISISPSNAKGVDVFSFYLISSNNAYRLQQRNENKTEYVFYLYVPQQVTVNGTEVEYGYSFEFDINAKQGWNAIYNSETKTKEKYSTNSSTVNLSKINWIASYEGPASSFGGPDISALRYVYCYENEKYCWKYDVYDLEEEGYARDDCKWSLEGTFSTSKPPNCDDLPDWPYDL